MAKARIKTVQVGFTAGELDPRLYGRIDQELYYKGASKLRNVAVNPQGHVTRRPGLQYIDSTTNNSVSRTIDFVFNTVQKYLLVFTAGEFKVYKDDVLQATINSAPINALTLQQIQELKFIQSADTLLIFHRDIQTIKITRTSHVLWTATTVLYDNIPWFAFGGPIISEPSFTLTFSSVTGRDVTATLSGGYFSAGSVGQYIYGKEGGIFRITAFTSSTVVVGQVEVDFPAVGPIAAGRWEYESGYEPVWSNARGWPSCGTFHQSRLYVANSGSRPQTIWRSRIADFFNFNIYRSEEDDASDLTIDDNRVNAILNIVSGRNLQIFTTGGEFYIPSDETGLKIVKSTAHGSSNVLPVAVGGVTLFIENAGKVIREFVYNELEQNYTATNVSILSSHLINNPVSSAVRPSTSDSPADYYYVVNSDGTMAVLNIARDQKLLAWSLWTTDGEFEEVTVLGLDVYVTVKRNINGSEVRYIEKFNNNYFLDASKIVTNPTPTTTWSGFSHLDNETVKIRGDGFILDDAVVTAGNLTSSLDVEILEAGVLFLCEVTTLPIETMMNDTQLAGDWKRLVWANIRLHNSQNIVINHNGNRYVPAFRSFGSDLLDQPVSLFSGWKKVFLQGTGRDVDITITQEYALEFEILAILVAIR